MLITQQITPDFLSVKCNYSVDYVARFRKIPGAEFDRGNKVWVIPVGAIEWYEEQFRGEIVWKTPRWVVMNEPMPDFSKMYTVNNSIVCPTLKLQPFDYQKSGIRIIIDRLIKFGFIICADDVGLGKTIEAVGAMQYMRDNFKVKRVLIACKKSLKTQWKSELNKFSDLDKVMPAMIISGTKKQREKQYLEFNSKGSGIMIANYQTLLGDEHELEALKFDMMVADEIHYIKSRIGKMNNAAKDIAVDIPYKLFLTGTPIMSKPDDIFGILQIADSKYLGNWGKFQRKHIKYDVTKRFTCILGVMELDELREKVQDVVLRRTEFEVDVELPEMLPPTKIECGIDNTQLAIAESIRDERQQLTDMLDGLNAKKVKTPENEVQIGRIEGSLKGLIAASQALANDPRLFFMSKSAGMVKKYGALVKANYVMSSKNDALLGIIEDIVQGGHKVIIFSKFERSTRLIQEDITKSLKYDSVVYSGVVSDEQREINIQRFKNDPDCSILIGTDAMAEGLNLEIANHCIHYDQPSTPAIKTQRAGRIRRVGSKFKHAHVYDLITENSCDVTCLESIEKSQALFDGLITLDVAQSKAVRDAIAKEN